MIRILQIPCTRCRYLSSSCLRKQLSCSLNTYYRCQTTSATTVKSADATIVISSMDVAAPTITDIPPPTREQLKLAFLHAAIPMIGFGFMDNTIMLHAGNVIDCTVGVTFGLSTLTAAAFGQVVSDASGTLFGGTLENLAVAAGLPKSGLSNLQRTLPIYKHTKLLGAFLGVIFGCCLGLTNLLFIDTQRSATLKLEAFNEEQEFEFRIEASNAEVEGMTMLKVTGPDVDGLLASMTAALSVRGCSLVELHAKRRNPNEILDDDENADKMIEDIFYVVKRETGKAFDNDELDDLARGLLDSTRTPMNVNSVRAAMHELESTNSFLRARVKKLEQVMYQKQITITPLSSSSAAAETTKPTFQASSLIINDDEEKRCC